MSLTGYQVGQAQNTIGNLQDQNQNNMSFMTGAGGAALSMLGGFIGAGSQHRRQRELMSLQHQNQMALNRQGHDLQFDMWKKTSYPAQLAMMKQAGLSPGLMYGGGPGAGGSTGSQTGGSAAGGSAAAFNPMEVAQLMLLKAQSDKLKAETGNIEEDTRLKGNQIALVEANVKNVSKQTLKIIQETSNLKTQGDLLRFEKAILKLKVDKKVTGSAFVDLLTQVGLDPVNNEADKEFLGNILIGLGVLRGLGDIGRFIGGLRGFTGNKGQKGGASGTGWKTRPSNQHIWDATKQDWILQ